jgi:hypothetical protein
VDIARFGTLSTAEKISAFDDQRSAVLNSLKGNELHLFLKSVIADEAENTYVRKQAVTVLTDCVILKELPVRNGLNVLLDEWNETSDVSLEVQRLKDVSLFYDSEEDGIRSLFETKKNDSEAEISSEASYRLGQIFFQQAMLADAPAESKRLFTEAVKEFHTSRSELENRLDADFFFQVSQYLLNFLTNRLDRQGEILKACAGSLLRFEAFSMKEGGSRFFLGFYRSLVGLKGLTSMVPEEWLDFRAGLQNLHSYYSEIQTVDLDRRLSESGISASYRAYLNKHVAHPYFVNNLGAESTRIRQRLLENDLPPEEKEFLVFLDELVSDDGLKKKAKLNDILPKLTKAFPKRSPTSLESALAKIHDGDIHEVIQMVLNLATPSRAKFLDALIDSCIKLQGTKIYWAASEDDRNTFIANMLEADGYHAKDQTRWGQSNTGLSAGEIDIYVEEVDGKLLTIIEALNLTSIDKAYIKLHIDKIFRYDTTGLKENFILVYATVGDFENFWTKYWAFVTTHDYEYPIIASKELNDLYPFADLRLGRTNHRRNGRDVSLLHIATNIPQVRN